MGVTWLGSVELDAVSLLKRSKSSERDTRDAGQVKAAGSKILAALDIMDPHRKGVTRRKLREQARVSSRDLTGAATELLAAGVLEEVSVEVKSGKKTIRSFDGLRRRSAG